MQRLLSRSMRAAQIPRRCMSSSLNRKLQDTAVPASSAAKQNFSTPSESKENPDLATVLDKYGLMTTVGLGAAALVTKEIFIVDAEVLVAGIFATVVGYGYVTLGDSIRDSIDATSVEMEEAQISARDTAIKAIDAQIAYHQRFLELTDHVQALHSEIEETGAKAVVAANRKMAIDKNDFLSSRLEELKNGNAFGWKMVNDAMVDKVLADVKSEVAIMSDAEKTKIFQRGVTILEGKDGGEDPITKMFMDKAGTFKEDFGKLSEKDMTGLPALSNEPGSYIGNLRKLAGQ